MEINYIYKPFFTLGSIYGVNGVQFLRSNAQPMLYCTCPEPETNSGEFCLTEGCGKTVLHSMIWIGYSTKDCY